MKKLMASALAVLLLVGNTLSSYAAETPKSPTRAEQIGGTNVGVRLWEYRENIFIISDEKGKFGYVNDRWVDVLHPQYDEARSIFDGMAVVKKGEMYGCLNKSFKQAIPFVYTYMSNFMSGYCVVSQQYPDDESTTPSGGFGLIDKNNRIIIPLEYDTLFEPTEGLCGASKDRKSGFLDTQGRVAIPFIYDEVRPFYKGYAHVWVDGKWGLIDKHGRMVAEPIYESLSQWQEGGLFIFSMPHKIMVETPQYGLMKLTGEVVLPATYDEIQDYQNGYATIKTNQGYGLIDATGKVVIAPKYAEPLYMGDNGLIAFSRGGKYGYMDIQEKQVLAPIYATATPFYSNVAWVSQKGTSMLINSSGKELIPASKGYDNIWILESTPQTGIVLASKGMQTDIYKLIY